MAMATIGLCGLLLASLLPWGHEGDRPGGGSPASADSAMSVAHASAQSTRDNGSAPGNAAPPAHPVVARADMLLTAAASAASTADARLLRIYGLIATSQAQTALEEAARLAADLPNFALAQLVYADLLATQAAPNEGFGPVNLPLQAAAADRLRELVAEARARVTAAGQRPPPGTVPSPFVRLDPSVKHAIAVDVSKSRLYVLENSPAGMVVVRDFYSSVGKLGMAKRVEGDLRTPLGVYFVTGRIPEARLRDPAIDDLYGDAALALNYPNQYDQFKGRTGSGIWLHGVATALFSRAPLATDGCVALANPDMLELTRFVERQQTPVLILDQIEWVRPDAALQRNAAFMRQFDAWKAARSAGDVDAQQRFYAAEARLRGGPAPASAGAAPVVDSVSVLSWRDERDVVLVTYTESAPGGRSRLKRQYWLEQAGQWQVIFEGNLG
jgi:L,D-peptidoglycan transpeptidase YkuD (ErfK/YbiS/YcfS/YnhG family)